MLAAVHLASVGKHCSGVSSLTVRQLEILEYLRTGCSYGEIADALEISIETVRTHAAVIRRRLGVKSKRELLDTRVAGEAVHEKTGTRSPTG